MDDAGYALVLVDARGSGASSGQRPVGWSDAEVADLGEVTEWITSQPWSDGTVGAVGISYSGNTAELSAMYVGADQSLTDLPARVAGGTTTSSTFPRRAATPPDGTPISPVATCTTRIAPMRRRN